MRSAPKMASIALVSALALAPLAARAQPAAPPAPASPPATPSAPAPAAGAAAHHYTTADTDLGTLLDDPAARAILDRHLHELVASEQINMARGMTLRALQQYAPAQLPDAKLTQIDQELAALPARP